MDPQALTEEIKAAALGLGFHAVGVTRTEPFKLDERRLQIWIDDGSVADLEYMQKSRDLRARPADLMPEAKSILSLAVSYYSGDHEALPEGHGRIARYAWGRDYHEVIPDRLEALVKQAERIAGRPIAARCFTDAVPLLERAVARRSKVGRVGLNSLIINDRYGSWIFLADILWDLDLTPDTPEVRNCLSTNECIQKCPTGAIVAYRVDARKCISYHTIENRGIIDRTLRKHFGDWLYGCDVCQEVCPHNRKVPVTDWQEFHPSSGVGQTIALLDVLAVPDDQTYSERYAGTALMRTGRRGLVRNACIVAANLHYEPALPAIRSLAESDPDSIVRAHALGALSEFGRSEDRPLIEKALLDPAEEVRAEATSALG